MLIGMTYDLRAAYLADGYGEEETAEFDREETIIAIESALLSAGHSVQRIGNVYELIPRLAAGDRWDLVFNICEGLRGNARESQVPAILDAYEIPYTFADASVLALCLNKAWTKSVIGSAVPVADYAVVKTMADIDRIRLPLPLFVKPLLEGTGKGISPACVIRQPQQLADQCLYLLETFRQPVLVETFLPGREFTVSLLGSGDNASVLGTFEILLRDSAEPEVYGYINKEECESRVTYRLVDAATDRTVENAEANALLAWRLLDCRDAGRIDLRCNTDGEPCFIEVNPLAGMNPVHSDLPMLATAVGMAFPELVRRIVVSAQERVRARPSAVARVA
jgi:D-alanine-D-alanine ligase